MKEFTYVIADPQGIHARPAGLFVKKASEFASSVVIGKGEKSADAKRIFGVMGLGVKNGDEIFIRVEGADEENAAEVLEAFLKENL
ncbi:HPr family phosphocarrier protein [Suipraeoptans intestinalis]|uniref:HPr family phosphocarrier protein n=1 Tax=Suipraeoptans intestinalis TaxID=2606628 RepID=A0A6N7V246_9FIRM|nr:HPr family phosphocarrier protein [Suipraeoptans intestinalis]MDD7770334.1 HPr family phosphocarrier protein [Suipraeoptans intestinalis]MDY3121303.1 HPr family phosphocarrier protein [Suipraeoptans intestinalis]MSR93342.1 HPr family phosphocarrier protein [Suipraeoptans intestinalis]